MVIAPEDRIKELQELVEQFEQERDAALNDLARVTRERDYLRVLLDNAEDRLNCEDSDLQYKENS